MKTTLTLRSQSWLSFQFSRLWQLHFSDVPTVNPITVRFGRFAKTRLGSIKRKKVRGSASTITVTGFFRYPDVPEQVVLATLAHEITHYLHGFHSDLPQLQKYPHEGNIVDKELQKRGLSDVVRFQKKWLTLHWRKVVRRKRA
ncbi:MAG TPA: hypothetical protein VJB91_02545 [Patescibacteria group bacterium]|nr:hypothetical protein [Patescibacteria group bacterium]